MRFDRRFLRTRVVGVIRIVRNFVFIVVFRHLALVDRSLHHSEDYFVTGRLYYEFGFAFGLTLVGGERQHHLGSTGSAFQRRYRTPAGDTGFIGHVVIGVQNTYFITAEKVAICTFGLIRVYFPPFVGCKGQLVSDAGVAR